jgi:predicted dehydrogenase
MFDASKPLRVGVVGCRRGLGLARDMTATGLGRVTGLCDLSEPALNRARATFPEAHTTADLHAMAKREDIDAIFVATPDERMEQMVDYDYEVEKVKAPDFCVPLDQTERRDV